MKRSPVGRRCQLMPTVSRTLEFALVGAVCAWGGGRLSAAEPQGAGLWSQGAGYRQSALTPGTGAEAGFTLLPVQKTGLAFTNSLPATRFLTNQIHLNGSGVALGDVDGDGWCDVFLAGLGGGSALFRNLGEWRFTNVTAQAALPLRSLDVTGAVLADVDGDSDLDLLVNTIGTGTHVLLNDGQSRFLAAPGSPFNLGRGGMSLALADIDGDSDLDVFVGNYRTDTFRDQPGTRFRGKNLGGRMLLQTVNGRPVTDPDLVGRYTIHASGGIEEHGEADVMLVNEGDGKFREVGMLQGLFLEENGQPLTEPPYDWTLSVAFRDLNGDRAPDLYVCNDFSSPDELWLNDGHGHFRRSPRLALRHTPMFSMGVDFADLNHDGREDFIVVDMLGTTHAKRHTQLGDVRPQWFPSGIEGIPLRPQYSFNQLFLGRNDGTFAEVGWAAGVAATDWTWNPMFLDVDLDGLEDLLFATGHELEMMDADIGAKTDQMRRGPNQPAAEVQRMKLLFPRHNIPNVALRNRGDLTFGEATRNWRFGLAAVSTGMAAADLDNDGDLDVVLNNLNDPASLLRNDAPAPRLAVRLAGAGANTRGIGAKIRVLGGPAPQSQEIMAGGRYLSGDATERVFATGDWTKLSLEVTWRSGRVSRLTEVSPNIRYEIRESDAELEATLAAARAPAKSPPLLVLDRNFNHRHVDESFDDFAAQPLLPNRLSGSGPGIAWLDLDDDGAEDLVIGTGRGGTMGFFHNDRGTLVPWPLTGGTPLPVADRDVLGLAAWWPSSNAPPHLLAAQANWEDGDTKGAALVAWNRTVAVPVSQANAGPSSPGAIAVADIDADGDLDVLLGGRAVPGKYPAAAETRLLENRGGTLIPRAELKVEGMVAGATWTDLEGDGYPELVVATDWGPIQIFRNRGREAPGQFLPWNPRVRFVATDSARRAAATGTLASVQTLSDLTGCWSGVASVDLDADGRSDLVLGNWGRNSRWQLAGNRPMRLYYGDYDGNGANEVLEAVFVPELNEYAPLRNLKVVGASLPFVREVTPTFAAFGKASVPAILGPRVRATKQVEAAVFESLVLLNRGDHFEASSLPYEAEVAPVFAVLPGDFDGDGNEDVFLSQNFFGVNGDTHREDAGRGLLLLGDGVGGLRATASEESGIVIDGEQRGAAVADFDGDGRLDLVVAQNGAETRLYRNSGARPGLRVRLAGPPANPRGVGARIRLRTEARPGLVREIHAGSGWCSQDGLVAVIGTPSTPTEVEVLWPGGRLARVPVPAGAREVTIRW